MDIRRITDRYAVSPMIDPTDLPEIKAAGFTTVICNRPDAEIPPSHQAVAMRIATEAAGLKFVDNPVTHAGLNEEMVMLQRDVLDDSEGPVLAYCASGTRSSIVWSLGQAGRMSADDILEATAKAGYDLGGLRPRLEALAGEA